MEEQPAAADSSSSASPTNWRKEVDERLRRLHSLLFGAEAALERGDAAAAQALALRLLGFLDSQTLSTDAGPEAAFVAPIRAAASSSLATASRARAPESDRAVFELAKKDVYCVFTKQGDVNIEKVKRSKYFQALHQNFSQNAADPLNAACQEFTIQGGSHIVENPPDLENEKLNVRASKLMTQTKITSSYSSKFLKANSVSDKNMFKSEGNVSKEFACVENEIRTNQDNKHPVYLGLEEDEKHCGPVQIAKRKHTGFRSPICEHANSPSSNDETDAPANGFVTARIKLAMDAVQKHGHNGHQGASVSPQCDNNLSTRNYGARPSWNSRRGPRGNFVPPIRNNGGSTTINSRVTGKNDDPMEDSTKKCLEMLCGPDGELPEKLRNLEPRLIEHISNEIMDKDPNVRWDDIAGLHHAKKCVTEMVIWPLLRPDIFRGCRSPGRGLLLFGPPGTGKTMIGKAIAGEAKATFFYISSSSLTSKWIGEGEKLVRALFGVACCRQPAVIFVDEIDSLLSQRKSDGEHESSRRLKTQFLIEMEGFDSGNEQILLIGATNRPQELDEAARRRLTKRLYIPLPSSEARTWIIHNLLEKDGLFKLSEEETGAICKLTEGYSGSDMKNLVKDASMGPLREAFQQGVEITKLNKEEMRPVMLKDFEAALQQVRPSVSASELGIYEEWNKQFGSLAI
ncbi:ATPase family AAA domain-containing protein FIGL1 isoform X1 [Lolium perenne]|uniref:ATPase family AAA domain-containing protein FIGL1 isoform X1 n=1 Tax=Lolium perenne TaxID=4522 RepID=UPI0021EB137C|nr:ATPase family AAA domain-containing protein FIGL1 isoform X1 [Lolium perenne]XP_051196943.1 ATPase family AAA domain-containing protein FIGL1 isoform X1 [Lolium perenne]XP_051196949.1 ATPase family AAA domain-containing protein FIGL1 isoform X1 [Lolium perenne]